MEFPDDIREYSKPLTNPNWKTLHKLTHYEFSIQSYYLHYKYPICNLTFERLCRVAQYVVTPPTYRVCNGNGCKRKTKRLCSNCSIHTCFSCKTCNIHR